MSELLPELINKIFTYVQSPTNEIMKDYFYLVEDLERKNQLYRIKKDKYIYLIWLNSYHGYKTFDFDRLSLGECKCLNIYMRNTQCYCGIHGYLD